MCTGVELRWLATLTLVEIKFSCTQVDATFSPFGHQTHPVRCFYNPLASEVQDMFSWNDLRLTCTCKETWESVCPGLDCFLRFEEVTYTLLSFLARFLDYGEESWKNEARESLKDLNTWVLTWRYCVFVCFLFLGRWQAKMQLYFHSFAYRSHQSVAKTFFNRRNLKTPTFCFRVDGKHFGKEVFFGNEDVTIIIWTQIQNDWWLFGFF